MNEALKAELIAQGLEEALATLYATISKIDENTDMKALASQIKAAQPQTIDNAEVDRRISKALETQKKKLEAEKTGEESRTTEPEKRINADGLSPELKAFMDSQAAINKQLLDATNTLVGTKKATDRANFVKKALLDAGIPEKNHKFFKDNAEVEGEEFSSLVASYKQDLADFGISGLSEPNGGGLVEAALEKQVAKDAKDRGEGISTNGVVKPKSLGVKL